MGMDLLLLGSILLSIKLIPSQQEFEKEKRTQMIGV